MLETLKGDVVKPSYDGCTEFTLLSNVLILYNLKVKSGWSDTNFTELPKVLNLILLTKNVLSPKTYAVKKMLCSVDLNYEKIHAE